MEQLESVIHKLDNSMKSSGGNIFNKSIGDMLTEYLDKGLIRKIVKEPKYTMPGYVDSQFNPDFEITTIDGSIIVIDNTTSLRSDRIKQKQWDALGIKTYFNSIGETSLFYVIIPNKKDLGTYESNEAEVRLYENYKDSITSGRIYSAIDDILEISEFLEQIKYIN